MNDVVGSGRTSEMAVRRNLIQIATTGTATPAAKSEERRTKNVSEERRAKSEERDRERLSEGGGHPMHQQY